MKKLRLYLDTSVWNFYYADDAPEKKEVTRRFLKTSNQTVIISTLLPWLSGRLKTQTRKQFQIW
ncbi:MAG: hypothetical protein HZB81_03825 [Deltaproteobacteria bacterium]|nr:hypothetical protein [Deltaproteobacteria bacterium]